MLESALHAELQAADDKRAPLLFSRTRAMADAAPSAEHTLPGFGAVEDERSAEPPTVTATRINAIRSEIDHISDAQARSRLTRDTAQAFVRLGWLRSAVDAASTCLPGDRLRATLSILAAARPAASPRAETVPARKSVGSGIRTQPPQR